MKLKDVGIGMIFSGYRNITKLVIVALTLLDCKHEPGSRIGVLATSKLVAVNFKTFLIFYFIFLEAGYFLL